ncbi:MAG: peptide chain release factor N(5)-glutamine methyltransferase [Candidatus Lambdaproteobacteria bacterium]|nr:peptide chain release factor N(5)-glutamine methyltransferase [Candidatus Lambdaproteobacteria bacterium]
MNQSSADSRAASTWTVAALLKWCEGYFREKGLPSPRLDGELLLAHVLGLRRLDLYLQFDRPLTQAELAAFRPLVQARAARRPVAYLTGEAGFWGLTLAVRPGCLVPRPDTETLVEAALGAIAALRAAMAVPTGNPEAPLTLVELGTGTGAIPLALCAETRGLTCVSVERSAEALACARENRARHAALLAPRSNDLRLVRGDRLEALHPAFRPHLLVSNPPYIPSAAIAGLEPEVAQAEPRAALDGGPDGLDFHRNLLAFAAERLAPGGRVLFEIGHDQAEAVRALAAAHPTLREIELRRDLAKRPRVFHAERRAG